MIWRCVSYWKLGFSSQSFVRFQGCKLLFNWLVVFVAHRRHQDVQKFLDNKLKGLQKKSEKPGPSLKTVRNLDPMTDPWDWYIYLHEWLIFIGVSKNRGGPPQIIHFNRVFHYKPSILGYPYFWKHPYGNLVGKYTNPMDPSWAWRTLKFLECEKTHGPGNSAFSWPFWEGEFTWPFKLVNRDLQLGNQKVTFIESPGCESIWFETRWFNSWPFYPLYLWNGSRFHHPKKVTNVLTQNYQEELIFVCHPKSPWKFQEFSPDAGDTWILQNLYWCDPRIPANRVEI